MDRVQGKNTIQLFIRLLLGQLSRRGKLYKTDNARLLVHLWAEIMHSVLDSPTGNTRTRFRGPRCGISSVALLAHRALFGPECTRYYALSVYYDGILSPM